MTSSTLTSQAVAHPVTFSGSFSPTTRKIPALLFIEKYSVKVDSLDLSTPYSAWYAHKAIFYNSDGKIYRGGEAIWNWMRGLFGPQFRALHHQVYSIRMMDPTVDELVEVGLSEGDGASVKWVQLEVDTVFWLSGPGEEKVVARRMLAFLVGTSKQLYPGAQEEAQKQEEGTDGHWILMAKAWWDSTELARKLAARR